MTRERLTRARDRTRTSIAILVVILAGGCGAEGRPGPTRALPPVPPTVAVTMSEFRFVFANRVPAGRVVFAVVNGGRLSHRMSLIELGEDDPPVAALVESGGGSLRTPLVQMPVLGPDGTTGTFAVELLPASRYAMVSTWPGPGGRPDFELGMAAEFRTSSGPGSQ